MKKKPSTVLFLLFVAVAIFTESSATEPNTPGNATATNNAERRLADRRPSFWTKTANNLKASTPLRMYKPYENLTKLQKRFDAQQQYTTETAASGQLPRRVRINPRSEEAPTTTESNFFETTTILSPEGDDLESRIMRDETFIGLKEFASQLINDTAKLFSRKSARSYPVDEPPPQLWDDKDQTYHASTFATAEYEPTSFHHHYMPPPPLHYYPPPKKEDALLTKVAMIALLKLILAKLKAIGFLKLMFFFMMKIPIMFFKFLFILKSFKLLKLVSIPFIMASFAAPFLPLIPFFAPLLFAPLLFAPLFLPLMLPLLFFLPIVPVSTPLTASSTTTRKRRETTFNSPGNLTESEGGDGTAWTPRNDTRARYMRTRASRPYDSNRRSSEYPAKANKFEDAEEETNLLALTRKIVESQHCMERVACELASQNDSKIYQAAVVWALGKVHGLASPRVRRKIELYSDAYKTGAKWQSSDICRTKFFCQRPRILLVQGKAKYNVF